MASMIHHNDLNKLASELGVQVIDRVATPMTPNKLCALLPITSKPRTIHVLDLDPLPARCNDSGNYIPLAGNWRVVSLETCPAFTAVSYLRVGFIVILLDQISCNSCGITTNYRDSLFQIGR